MSFVGVSIATTYLFYYHGLNNAYSGQFQYLVAI